MAMIPLRPAWRDSDPRWRRRILAGVWILVLLPLVDVLRINGWASRIPVPIVFHFPDSRLTLDDTFLHQMRMDQPLLFCIGVVLLFAKERGRRRNPLDWTRRWGILCSYITFLLSVVEILFITALVAVGISALFLSMPRRFQPGFADTLRKLGAAYLSHMGQPKPALYAALVAFSSFAMLLACAALFNALRSSFPKRFTAALANRLAAIVLAPLALFALINLAQAAIFCVNPSRVTEQTIYSYRVYFRPQVLVDTATSVVAGWNVPAWEIFTSVVVETAKWCIVLATAIWLSIAQLAACWRRKKTSAK